MSASSRIALLGWVVLCRGQRFANYLISLPSAASGDFTRAIKIIAAASAAIQFAAVSD